ncbi:MAG: 3-keto-disaccharide hydrolase [Thermoguttaceae bacterium]
MKRIWLLLTVSMFFCVVWAVPVRCADFSKLDKDGFVTIFNGTDLTDWEGKPGVWTVRDGAIVGESTPENLCDTNYIYWTAREPGDFHLKLKYRLTGKGANSGIQIRSERRPNWDAFGYQADIDEDMQWSGCLFHHTRGAVVKRGCDDKIATDATVTSKQFAPFESLVSFIKSDGWNDYEVIADGSVITLMINGELMCRVDDKHPEATKKGIIALQMHTGPPMKVEFKDIKIKPLGKEAKKP